MRLELLLLLLLLLFVLVDDNVGEVPLDVDVSVEEDVAELVAFVAVADVVGFSSGAAGS